MGTRLSGSTGVTARVFSGRSEKPKLKKTELFNQKRRIFQFGWDRKNGFPSLSNTLYVA